MSKDLVNQKENKFIKKSNVIVRAVTNESAGIMTQRLFNFVILSSIVITSYSIHYTKLYELVLFINHVIKFLIKQQILKLKMKL